MPHDETTRPKPPGLEDSYDLLNELRRSDGSTTWLAYDRTAHRDVIVTHVHAATSSGQVAGGTVPRDVLAQIGADAQLLAAHRHPAGVQVLASHWLDDGSLAVVRPRVRGTTLRQILLAAGALPLDRTVALLREIGETLDWARRTGIVYRGLTAESICFQQGANRALVAFGPALALDAVAEGTAPVAADSAPGSATRDLMLEPVYARCSDTATLGRLAWEMLTTRAAPTEGITGTMTRRGYREPGLADLRPDLPLSVAAEVESALRCERDTSPRGPGAFIAALAAAAGLGDAAAVPAASAVRVPPLADVPRDVTRVSPSAGARPVVPPPPARAPSRGSGMGVMAFTVVVVLALVGAFWYVNRDDDQQPRIAARTDTATVSGGDVAFDPTRVDTGVLVTPRSRALPTMPMPLPTPPTFPSGGAATDGPTVFSPRASMPIEPAPSPVPPTPVPETAPQTMPQTTSSDDACASTADADQQRCLRQRIGENDVDLNRTYQDLVRVMRDDPAAVADLRGRQRDWLARRDSECRGGVQRGTTWAPGVADCLAERSAARTRELQAELERRRP